MENLSLEEIHTTIRLLGYKPFTRQINEHTARTLYKHKSLGHFYVQPNYPHNVEINGPQTVEIQSLLEFLQGVPND